MYPALLSRGRKEEENVLEWIDAMVFPSILVHAP
jgi:hypothetical protein